ncbi:MAG: RNA helicase [Planctomycetes bacterium]|nr:RNA helicase [Planctomycetota bacterium]
MGVARGAQQDPKHGSRRLHRLALSLLYGALRGVCTKSCLSPERDLAIPNQIARPRSQGNRSGRKTSKRAASRRHDLNREEPGRAQTDESRPSGSKSGFHTFKLSEPLLRGVAALGFVEPRPIQAKTIPAAQAGRDVLGLAQTGTGKTAAFALPILERLLTGRRPGPRALIVAPTRELAMQINAEILELGRFTTLTATTIYGGVSMSQQVRALRARPDILVACPGRLLDLHQQRKCDLSRIEMLVLDEADHMFDMGFLPDIRRILSALPRERQNLLFSATMPREIRSLADRVLSRPHVVELEHSKPASTIDHFLYPVEQNRKLDLLNVILAGDDFTSAIVFLRTKHRARRVARDLDRHGHRAIALQGNMSQPQRDRAMTGFREGRFDILVATDIAARGIDVANISHVVNFDLPNTPDAYTHRIGRTGRAEESGKAITLVTREDAAGVKAIERKLGQKIPRRFIECDALPKTPASTPQRGGLAKKRRGAGRPKPEPFGSGVQDGRGAGRTRRAQRPKGAGPGRSRSRRRS